ncbi:hypothetical protein D3C76_1132820 [compost metagenome]
MATQQDLQVKDVFQGRRHHPHFATVADPAQVEAGELAMIEARLGMPVTRQADVMHPHMLIDVGRHGIRIGTIENPAALTEQGTLHTRTLVVVILRV